MVQIKDFTMPPACGHCPFCVDYRNRDRMEFRCVINMNIIEQCLLDRKHRNCPLMEIEADDNQGMPQNGEGRRKRG